MPRIIWMHLEEGKLTKIVEGVKTRAVTKKNNSEDGKTVATRQKEDIGTVANNVVQYINMEEAGHHIYGRGYLFCQV